MKCIRRSGLAVAAAAMVALPAWSGFGVAAAAGDDGPSAVYGMRPALAGTTTLSGGHFSYALPAGGHVDDGVEVINFSPGPLTVNVYAANVAATAEGGLAPAQPGQPATGATSWLTLKPATLTVVPSRGEQDAL